MSFSIICNVCKDPVVNHVYNGQFIDECVSCYHKRIQGDKDLNELKEIMKRLMNKAKE